ncbi:MAG: GAF domain-containing sensor histidine kinase [Elusimicrobia bacterium]|nr:GAF domain-containing sensor histidine kinase [Elusimicrobiota bacterium]
MSELSATATFVLLAVTAAFAAFAAYWYLRFERVLPLERQLRRLGEKAEGLRRFSIRKSREAKTLVDVAATVTHDRQTQSALGAVVAIIARYLEADMVAFLLADEATGELVVQPGAYGLASEELLYRVPLTDEASSSVRVFKNGESFLAGDAQNDPGTIARYARLWKIHSLMTVPIATESRTLGVLRVGSFKRDFFKKEHLDLLSVIAGETAVIVETAVLNRKLSRTAEQLGALNRMKDDFVSLVSHEFKTPLTTIMGFITVMLDGDTGELTDQQRKFLNVTKTAVKRLEYLVTELLDLSKLEAGAHMELRPLNLADLLRASVERQRGGAEIAGKTIICELPEAVPWAMGDERWLTLVVDNLLSNAVKFTRPGGRVNASLADKGDFVMVCVADDGLGIPAEDREHIFEKFYRARNAAQGGAGTGLGLAIARDIVLKHGGKIWFESETGKGTKFCFVVSTSRQREAVL